METPRYMLGEIGWLEPRFLKFESRRKRTRRGVQKQVKWPRFPLWQIRIVQVG